MYVENETEIFMHGVMFLPQLQHDLVDLNCFPQTTRWWIITQFASNLCNIIFRNIHPFSYRASYLPITLNITNVKWLSFLFHLLFHFYINPTWWLISSSMWKFGFMHSSSSITKKTLQFSVPPRNCLSFGLMQAFFSAMKFTTQFNNSTRNLTLKCMNFSHAINQALDKFFSIIFFND